MKIDEITLRKYEESDAVMKELRQYYVITMLNLKIVLNELLAKEEKITPLSLYKNNVYITLYNKFAQEMRKLGIKEEEILKEWLSKTYTSTFQEVADVFKFAVILNKAQIEKVITMNWAGRNFSTSIWRNKEKLIKQLQKTMNDVITFGMSKDEAIKIIMQVMDVGFADADRLVRTETMFVINQAQKDVYIAAGFDKYRYMAAHDERTSDICRSLDGKIFNFSEAQVGVNFPPMHPRCRSTIVPLLDKTL